MTRDQERTDDLVFMEHWNSHHVAASTDDKAEGVDEVSFFRAVHKQDHSLSEGFTKPHSHEDGEDR